MKKSLIALLLSSIWALSACEDKSSAKLLEAEKKIVQLETRLNEAKTALNQKEKAVAQQAQQPSDIFPALQVKIIKLCDKQKTIKLPKDPNNDGFSRDDTQIREFISTAKTGIAWLDTLLLDTIRFEESAELGKENTNKKMSEADIIAQCEKVFNEKEKIAIADRLIGLEHSQSTYYIGQRNNIVTFYQYHHSYTGGAHGMGYSNYLNIDINKKAVIALNDLIAPKNQEKVKELLWQNYAAERIDENGKYAGYADKNDFYIAETFQFTPEGIKFIYPVYTLGSYAEGEIEIFVNYNQLNGLINEDYFPTAKDGFELTLDEL